VVRRKVDAVITRHGITPVSREAAEYGTPIDAPQTASARLGEIDSAVRVDQVNILDRDHRGLPTDHQGGPCS
ncbi:MAG: hypothetical protein VW643_05715, partial [Opitutales bacterium]